MQCATYIKNETHIFKRSALANTDVRCAPLIRTASNTLYPFPKFCDWIDGEFLAYLVSEVLGMHIVPKVEVKKLPTDRHPLVCFDGIDSKIGATFVK